MRGKLGVGVSDLRGGSGLRMLGVLAGGGTDPKKLAAWGEDRLKCSEEQLVDALTGRPEPMHRAMLGLQLERLQLIDRQITQLNGVRGEIRDAARHINLGHNNRVERC